MENRTRWRQDATARINRKRNGNDQCLENVVFFVRFGMNLAKIGDFSGLVKVKVNRAGWCHKFLTQTMKFVKCHM
jgi:hypothetical protein